MVIFFSKNYVVIFFSKNLEKIKKNAKKVKFMLCDTSKSV